MNDFPFLGRSPHAIVQAAAALARDIDLIIECGATEQQFADAPTLEDWLWQPRLVPALSGSIDGNVGRTSEVFVVDPHGGWCRTWTGFYRLGRRQEARS